MKTREQLAFADLVERLAPLEPRRGWTPEAIKELKLTPSQVATVIDAESEHFLELLVSNTVPAVTESLRAPEGIDGMVKAGAIVWAAAHVAAERELLQPLIAYSESLRDDDETIPRRPMNHDCAVPYDEERRLAS